MLLLFSWKFKFLVQYICKIRKREVIDVKNRFGHCVSSNFVEEWETDSEAPKAMKTGSGSVDTKKARGNPAASGGKSETGSEKKAITKQNPYEPDDQANPVEHPG